MRTHTLLYKLLIMHVLRKSTFATVVALFVVAGLFVPATLPVQAQTTNDVIAGLLAQIASLQAQIAALTGGQVGQSFTFTRDLTVGSTGEDVRQLQIFLNNQGYAVATSGAGSRGNESTYFGALTRAALARYQAAQGISPAAGYFGPITRANVNAKLVVTVPPQNGDNRPGLSGGAGSVDSYDLVSGINNEEVGEGQDDVEVLGLEIEADDGSDLEIMAVRLSFDEGTANDDFEDYASEVSIWIDGEEFARVDADEFDDDNNWTSTISLDRGAIIERGETVELIVAVSGLNNIDSDNEGDTWTVDVTQLRFRDAQNSVISENPGTNSRTFSFESFATAADIEFRVSSGDDEINDAQTIMVDDSDDTDNVEVLSFEVEVRGNSDVTVDEIAVNFESIGAGVGEIINDAALVIDGDVVGNASTSIVSSTDTEITVIFDDLDLTFEAGETIEVIVTVDVNNLSGNFTSGDRLQASVNPDDAGWDIEDEEGDDLAAADKSGTASSENHTFFTEGLVISRGGNDTAEVDDSTPNAAGGEEGEYVIRFEVEAFGDTIYIPVGSTVTTSTVDTDDGIAYAIENSNGEQIEITGGAATSAAVSTTADVRNGFYVIEEGETESFTLTIVFTPATDGFYRAQLHGVNFNVGSAGNADTLQEAVPSVDFQTEFVDLDA